MSNDKQLQKAYKDVEKHISKAYAEIEKAKEIADKFQLSFQFSLGYGMGGMYKGKHPSTEEEWNDSKSCPGWDVPGEWVSSTESCE